MSVSHTISSGGNNRLLRSHFEQSGLQHFLDDPKNTEIAFNRPFEIWTESSAGWVKHEAPNLTLERSNQIATAFAVYNKLDIKKFPIISGVTPDGQRGQVVIDPACERNTVAFTIRRPSDNRFTLNDYQKSGRLAKWQDVSAYRTANTTLTDEFIQNAEAEKSRIDELNRYLEIPSDVHLQLFELEMLLAKANRDLDTFLQLAVEHKQNIVLVGSTGSGKTTFTKAVCDIVPLNTRIVTIEDTAELTLPYHDNKIHLFYKGDITPKELIKSCLRMKPDRIFLTELRSDEAFDYLMALNTGHGGSITTVHANDCQSAYYRVASLIKQSEIGQKLDFSFIMKEVYTTLDVVMFLDKTYVTEVSYDPIRKYRLQKGLEIKDAWPWPPLKENPLNTWYLILWPH